MFHLSLFAYEGAMGLVLPEEEGRLQLLNAVLKVSNMD